MVTANIQLNKPWSYSYDIYARFKIRPAVPDRPHSSENGLLVLARPQVTEEWLHAATFHKSSANVLQVRLPHHARFVGRGLVLPNHQFALDFAVVGKVTPFSFRQVAKAAEVKNPFIGALAAWIGTVGVQVEGGKSQAVGGGQAVIDTGARVLTRSAGARMLLFPQGKLVFDNQIREEDFRTGAMRMMNATVLLVGVDGLYYLPMAVHYKRDSKDATRFHRFVNALGIKSFRRWRDYELLANADGSKTRVNRAFTTYGATVAIGKPVAMADLPSDPRAATNLLAGQIKALLEIAEQN